MQQKHKTKVFYSKPFQAKSYMWLQILGLNWKWPHKSNLMITPLGYLINQLAEWTIMLFSSKTYFNVNYNKHQSFKATTPLAQPTKNPTCLQKHLFETYYQKPWTLTNYLCHSAESKRNICIKDYSYLVRSFHEKFQPYLSSMVLSWKWMLWYLVSQHLQLKISP